MIIDAHAHLYAPPSLYAYRSNLVAGRGQYGFFTWNTSTADFEKFADQNVEIMDGVGTDVQLLSPRPYLAMHGGYYRWDDMLAWTQTNNNLTIQTIKWHPKRFRGVAAIPQMAGQPIERSFDEIKRCVEDHGFVGVIVNPDPGEGLNAGPTMADPFWFPLYEKLCELDIPAHIHSSGSCGRETYDEHFASEESLAITSIARSDVFKRFPTLKLMISHGGGSIPYQVGRWRSNRQMSIEAGRLPKDHESFDATLKRFWYDTCLHNKKSLELLFDVVGTERCCFGTERPGSGAGIDAKTGRPYDDLKPLIESIETLSAAERKALFEGNARALFTDSTYNVVIMANLVLAMGTSHSPLLLLPAEEWAVRGKDDTRNPRLNLSDGRFLPYDQLEAEVNSRYADRATEATFIEQQRRCQRALDRLADELEAAKPDVVLVVGDDQEELFDLHRMPAFAMYYGEEISTRPFESMHYVPEWLANSPAGAGYAMDTTRRYPGAPAFGRHVVEHLVESGVDVAAVSAVKDPATQGFGHAYGFIIQRLFRGRKIPVLPAMLNTYYPPNRPTPKRTFQIGQAIRLAIDEYPEDIRVAVVASGGLSHFVCDEALDHSVLDAIKAGDSRFLQQLPRAALNSGSSEIGNWICVSGIVEGRGTKWNEYVPVHRTPAGTGIGLSFLTWA